jgi:hypothetical protein
MWRGWFDSIKLSARYRWRQPRGQPATAESGPKNTGLLLLLRIRNLTPAAVEEGFNDNKSVVLLGVVASVNVT